MTHRAKSRALYAAGAGIMALLAGGLVLISRNQAALNASQEIRYNSHLLATELRHSSEDLTRLARTYVVTGDSRYEEMYWDVLAVRNGEKPRPDGRRIALRKLMEEAGFTADEFAKLTDAENKSNGLVRTETIAMNAVKGRFDGGAGGFTKTGPPDGALARKLMHDEGYHAEKAVIMGPINEFDHLLDERTRAAVNEHIVSGNILLGAVGTILFAGVVVAFLIMRNINRVLTHAISNLDATANQVAAACAQMASTSSTVAEGASRQAAAVEETSASAEEIQSMTALNASHSANAAQLMAGVQGHVHSGDRALGEMKTSMSHIMRPSKEIESIIKVIDEIAFQTNILALNAAVEAARAGEAGLGFAVVADAVRQLAQRAAEAAASVSTMIAESLRRTAEGDERLQAVNQLFRQIIEGTEQVTALINDVSNGSSQQTQGVQQISKAIMEIERVTQSTAATAEEAAAATQEISARSQGLLDIVAVLQSVVTTSSK